MRRPITILATCLLVLGVAAPGAVAQEEPMIQHPIVGTWIIDAMPDVEGNPPELFSAGADGTTSTTGPDGTGFGVWTATGDRSADVTFVNMGTNPVTGEYGHATIRVSGEVAQDGSSFTGTYTVEMPASMMEQLGMTAGELGPATVVGERLTVEPMGETVGPWPLPEMLAEDVPG
jgi:hypothetical protein